MTFYHKGGKDSLLQCDNFEIENNSEKRKNNNKVICRSTRCQMTPKFDEE